MDRRYARTKSGRDANWITTENIISAIREFSYRSPATILPSSQPYVDTVYWSLVIEVVFYGWVALFMMLGWFPRRMDALILAWLAITFANELTIDAPLFEKLFIADDSGFLRLDC